MSFYFYFLPIFFLLAVFNTAFHVQQSYYDRASLSSDPLLPLLVLSAFSKVYLFSSGLPGELRGWEALGRALHSHHVSFLPHFSDSRGLDHRFSLTGQGVRRWRVNKANNAAKPQRHVPAQTVPSHIRTNQRRRKQQPL